MRSPLYICDGLAGAGCYTDPALITLVINYAGKLAVYMDGLRLATFGAQATPNTAHLTAGADDFAALAGVAAHPYSFGMGNHFD